MDDGVKLQVKNILQLFYPHACNYCLQKKWNAGVADQADLRG